MNPTHLPLEAPMGKAARWYQQSCPMAEYITGITACGRSGYFHVLCFYQIVTRGVASKDCKCFIKALYSSIAQWDKLFLFY